MLSLFFTVLRMPMAIIASARDVVGADANEEWSGDGKLSPSTRVAIGVVLGMTPPEDSYDSVLLTTHSFFYASYPTPSPAVLFLVVIVGFILIWKCRRTRATPDTESVGITPLRLRRVQRPISGPPRPARAGHRRLPSSDTLMTQSSDNVLAMPAQAYIRRAL